MKGVHQALTQIFFFPSPRQLALEEGPFAYGPATIPNLWYHVLGSTKECIGYHVLQRKASKHEKHALIWRSMPQTLAKGMYPKLCCFIGKWYQIYNDPTQIKIVSMPCQVVGNAQNTMSLLRGKHTPKTCNDVGVSASQQGDGANGPIQSDPTQINWHYAVSGS